MPELPEVEALTAVVADHAVGRRVARIDVLAVSVLKTYDPPVTTLYGETVTGTGRHGKFLDLSIGELHLVIHLARAGWLRWRQELPAAPPRPGKGPLALRLHLDDGSGFDLTEAGTKKRLAVYLVGDPQLVPGVAALGVDPLSPQFTPELFAELLSRRSQIKGLLRDQKVIAGIGNAYSDEILHVAKLSPFKIAESLSESEIDRLYAAVGDTLRDAVTRSAGLADTDVKSEKKLGMRVHGRTGKPCPVCGDTVAEVSFADSTLQYCPTCQTGGKPLADRRLSKLLK